MRARQTLSVALASFVAVLTLEFVNKFGLLLSSAEFYDDVQYSARFVEGVFDNANKGLVFYSWLVNVGGSVDLAQFVLTGLFALYSAAVAAMTYRLTGHALLSVSAALAAALFPHNFILGVFANGSYNTQFAALLCGALLLAALSLGHDRRPLMLASVSKALLVLATIVTTNGLLVPAFVGLAATALFCIARADVRGRWFLLIGDMAIIGALFWYVGAIDHPYESMPDRLDYSPAAVFFNANRITSAALFAYWDPFIMAGEKLPEIGWIPGLVMNAGLGLYLVAAVWLRRRPLTLAAAFCFFLYLLSVAPLAPSRISHMWHYQLPSLFLILTFLFAFADWSKTSAWVGAGVLAVAGFASMQQYQAPYRQDAANQLLLGAFIKENSEDWSKQSSVLIIAENKFPVSGVISDLRMQGYFKDYYVGDPAPKFGLVRHWNTSRIASFVDANAPLVFYWGPEDASPLPDRSRGASRSTDTAPITVYSGSEADIYTDISGQQNYRMRIAVASNAIVEEEPEYSETTPEMPFVSNVIALYHVKDRFRLMLRTGTDEQAYFDVASPENVHEIKLENRPDGALLSVNGRKVWSGPRLGTFGDLTVGKGYNDRYWHGEVYDLELMALD